MNDRQTIFSQVLEYAPLNEFRRCVARYRGDHKVQSFSCWDQFLCMTFAQLTYRESLRDIEACLRARSNKLYRMGFRGRVSRNTLAHANEVRDWRIYADFAKGLIATARPLYAHEDLGYQFDRAVYALDSTTIDLCLAVFPWALFRRAKAAIKMHTLLDLRGNIPTVVIVTPGNVHDVNILDDLVFEPGAIYIMDRAYMDFARLYRIHQAGAFFVTRAKRNLQCRRVYSQSVDKTTGLVCDQTIELSGLLSARDYPAHLRRIRYCDPKTDKRLVFLTNLHKMPAIIAAKIYKSRWQVELFFKWIKQHLRIKVFFGTTDNAVKTQVWIAISMYVLVAILKKRLALPQSLYSILQILSVTPFEEMPISSAFAGDPEDLEDPASPKQLILFD